MTRKRRRPAGNPLGQSARHAPSPPARAASAGPGPAHDLAPIGLPGAPALVSAAILLQLLLLGAWWLLRWFGDGQRWPAFRDVGLTWTAGAVSVSVVVGASLILIWARRMQAQGCGGRARVAALAAGLLILLALTSRGYDYLTLARGGISVWRPREALFPEADLHYLHAVKRKLKQLSGELEQQRLTQAARFSDTDQRRLDFVTRLQTNMVGWTEQEVGRWLDDLAQRRSLLEVVAYQVHALPHARAVVEERVREEERELARRRSWLSVLREYCEQQLSHRQLRRGAPTSAGEPAPISDAKSPSPNLPADVPAEAAAAAEPTTSEHLALDLTTRLEQVGADTWRYAQTVAHDAQDPTLAAEHLNQITVSLTQIDARQAFIREAMDPMWEEPAAPGLNRRFPWLQLPVSFPRARAWAAGFALLTGWHTVLLLVGALATTCWATVRQGLRCDTSLASASLWVHAAAGVGVVNSLVLYVT